MASIIKAQQSLGKNFTVGGSSRKEYQIGGVDSEVQKVIYDAADKFIKLAQQTIRKKRKIDTGKMSDIVFSEIYDKKGILGITIGYDKKNPASEYGKYQNKGVKGVKSSRNADSPYSFKDLNVSPKFIEAIMEWYLRHKNYIKTEEIKGYDKVLISMRKMNWDYAPTIDYFFIFDKNDFDSIGNLELNKTFKFKISELHIYPKEIVELDKSLKEYLDGFTFYPGSKERWDKDMIFYIKIGYSGGRKMVRFNIVDPFYAFGPGTKYFDFDKLYYEVSYNEFIKLINK